MGAVGCIIDKDRTTDQYKKTCTHELGHALGWAGHSSNTSDIMYSAGSSVTSLTSRDKNHLSQDYDYGGNSNENEVQCTVCNPFDSVGNFTCSMIIHF